MKTELKTIGSLLEISYPMKVIGFSVVELEHKITAI